MGKFTVEIVPKAEKEYQRLPDSARNKIRDKILSLEENPRPYGAKKLRETRYHRIRVGDFRVIYIVHDAERRVKVLSVGHRREVYR